MTVVHTYALISLAILVTLFLPARVNVKGRLARSGRAYIDVYLFRLIKILSFDLTAGRNGVTYTRKQKKKLLSYRSFFDYNFLYSVLLKVFKIRKVRLTVFVDISNGIILIVYMQALHIIRMMMHGATATRIETKTVYSFKTPDALTFKGIISFTVAQIIFSVLRELAMRAGIKQR